MVTRIPAVAAVAADEIMSASGPKRTSAFTQHLSAFDSKADMLTE
jgi:hypothetical protein